MEDYQRITQRIKYVHDPIYGFVHLSYLAVKIIDTPYFQRLRRLRQLGMVNYVYPSANHTRFEHSIGTYHLADRLLNRLINDTSKELLHESLSKIPELNDYYTSIYGDGLRTLDNYVCELIKIAALCHDLGHGPYSHVFDYFVEKYNPTHPNKEHEHRSITILSIIIGQNEELSFIRDSEIQFIANMIHPHSGCEGFVYQIVSNTLNDLDIDKYDYLVRDSYHLNLQAKVNINMLIDHVKMIEDKLVYPEQAMDTIINLFMTRYRLHKTVYCHKAVVIFQEMTLDIMDCMNTILNISNSLDDMNDFCLLTDDYIIDTTKFLYRFSHSNDENVIKAHNLIDRLERRKLYKIINYTVNHVKEENDEDEESCEDNDDMRTYYNKIGLVGGNKKNPLDSIYLYNTKELHSLKINNMMNIDRHSQGLSIFRKDINSFNFIPKNEYQEYITIVYNTK